MRFNTKSHDYTIESANALPTHSLVDAAYVRLSTQKGSFFADASFGSELYLLARSKDVTRIQQDARRYALEALEPLKKLYFLTEIAVKIAHEKKGYLAIYAELTQANGFIETAQINVKVAG